MNLDTIRYSLAVLEAAIDQIRAELPPEESVFQLSPGDPVQRAIDLAPSGAVIELAMGRYVVGTLTFPRPITLRMMNIDSLAESRATADWLLPVLASGGPQATIDGTHAKGVNLSGIAFETREDGVGETIIWQDAEDIRMDRIRIVGGANGCKRAIRGNGQHIFLTRSHIANIWHTGQDSQAFCAWDGAGPYTLTDNYLEAASENVMFGGADSQSADRIPADILIEGNTFTKRLEWKPIAPATVSGKVVKNLLELKSAKRVTIRGNTFERSWTDAQTGYALSFKSVNQGGTAPWSVTDDVLFENNVVKDVENGFNIQGFAADQPGGRTSRITIRGNDVQTSGVAIQITGGPNTVTLDRTSFVNGYTFLQLAGAPIASLTVSNVLANHNAYGVKGDGTGIGLASLTKFAPGFVWRQNVLLGGAGKGSYPPETWFDLASVPVGVTVGR
jgi:hypothetical protein